MTLKGSVSQIHTAYKNRTLNKYWQEQNDLCFAAFFIYDEDDDDDDDGI